MSNVKKFLGLQVGTIGAISAIAVATLFGLMFIVMANLSKGAP